MKAAVVVGNVATPTAGDTAWISPIRAKGHTAEFVSETASDLFAKLSTYDAVFITGTARDTGAALRQLPKPVVTAHSWQAMGLTSSGISTSSTNIWTMRSAHTLAAGRTGNQAPWVNAGTTRHTAGVVAGATVVAVVNGGDSRQCFFLVPAGTTLATGDTAPAVRIGISSDDDGSSNGSAAYEAWRGQAIDLVATVTTPAPPTQKKPTATASATTPVGPGDTFVLSAAPVVGPNDPPVTSRSWTEVTVGAPELTGASTDFATGSTATAGTYVYQYVAANSVGTSDPVQVSVTVLRIDSPLMWWDGATYQPFKHFIYRGPGLFQNMATGEYEDVQLGAALRGVFDDDFEDEFGA